MKMNNKNKYIHKKDIKNFSFLTNNIPMYRDNLLYHLLPRPS